MAMKHTRMINKKTSNKGTSRTPVKPMSESGADYGKKASRDGANVNARYGKKAVVSGDSRDFKGELIIDSPLSPAEKEEILSIARNTGKTGPRDADDRIVRIEERGGKLLIFTAENRLAVSIGKRVHRAHKGSTLTITWASDELPVRVHWTRKG